MAFIATTATQSVCSQQSLSMYQLQYRHLYPAYLRDEVHKCERQLSPLSVVCASLSAVYVIENVTIAKVSIETRYCTVSSVVYVSNNQVPLSAGDLQNYTSRVIPEISIKCSAAGELVPCLIAVPTYDNNTCVNALLKVCCLLA